MYLKYFANITCHVSRLSILFHNYNGTCLAARAFPEKGNVYIHAHTIYLSLIQYRYTRYDIDI